MRKRLCGSHPLWGLAILGIFGVICGCSGHDGAKPAAEAPDLSGIWLGKAIQSLSPSDPTAQKAGTEGDIPYTPWALAKMKSERPATGPNQTFENTTTIYTISDELSFRQRFLNEKPTIPIRTGP